MPVRILHTADWHVGRGIARRPRLDEHRAVLAEIVAVAARERVDAVVVAGDVFDQRNPGPEAERVAFGALAELARAVPRVVVVAGNHDSPRRWDAVAPLAGPAGIAVVADPGAGAAASVVEVAGAGGARAVVACLPWVPEHRLLRGDDLLGGAGAPGRSYAEGMRAVLAALAAHASAPGLPVVLAAHLHVADAALGGGERPHTVGPAYAVPGAALPAGVAYGALGHVHRGQPAPGAPAWRYSGSPLQLDFSECDDAKHVVLAEVGARGEASARAVPLSAGRRLHRLAGTLEELAARAAAGEVPGGWLQVTVRAATPVPGLGDRVRELLPDAVEVRVDAPAAAPRPARPGLRGLTARQMFARYLADRAGVAEPDPELLDRFERLLEEEGGTGGGTAGEREAA